MLTDSEKKWLEERKPPTVKPWCTTADDNFCNHCKQYDIDCVPWFRNTGDCPTHRGGDYRDAAEFEARVAVKLALNTHPVPCIEHGCPHKMPNISFCVPCRLKHARLAVEAEMEENNE